MDELTVITDYIQDQIGVDAEMIFGHGSDAQLKDSIRVTIIATGFEEEKAAEAPPASRLSSQGPQTSLFGSEASTQTASTRPKHVSRRTATPMGDRRTSLEATTSKRYRQSQAGLSEVEGKNAPLSEEKIKEWLEVPAYLRRDVSLAPPTSSSEQDIVRHQLDDEDEIASSEAP